MGQDERDALGDPRVWRAAVQNPTSEQLPNEKQAARRVLIVHHDENVLIALKRLLGEANFNVTVAQDGLKAVQLLWQGAFELLLLDDNLPDETGELVVRQARRLGTGMPVVVMQSALPSDEMAVRYARAGACFFINRRDPEGIAELVHEYFSRPLFLCAHVLEPELGARH